MWNEKLSGKCSLIFSSSYTSLPSGVDSLTAHLPPRYCWSTPWNVYLLGKKLLFILNLHKDIFALPTVIMEPDSLLFFFYNCAHSSMPLALLGLGGGGLILPAPHRCCYTTDRPVQGRLPGRQGPSAVTQAGHRSAPGLGFNALKLILKLNHC